jgi:RHS repeat-associated protein
MVSAIRQRDHQAAVTNYLGTLNDVEARHAPGDSSPFLVRRGRRACGWQRRGNRLTQTGTMVLAYNALGQRIRKQGGSPGTVLFVYDDQGHLLGEYSSTGALVQETLWLGNIPVATLRPKSGGGIDLFYVHSDHLNTPRKVTRPSDNAIRWRWDPTPFGTGAPNQNPASLGTFVYHLRLPGQYFDTETALHYNYFRDYDPQIGRYLESDPIGLQGGINTYGYVGGRPTMATDPRGLLFCDDWKWMAIDWALGLGDRNRTYGAESDQVQRLKNLPAVNWARQRYQQKNANAKNGCCDASRLQDVANVKSSFGISEFIQATMQGNCAWHFIGSARVDVTPISCTQARFKLTNNSSFTSFSYGLAPSWNGGPMGNFYQTYTWDENL